MELGAGRNARNAKRRTAGGGDDPGAMSALTGLVAGPVLGAVAAGQIDALRDMAKQRMAVVAARIDQTDLQPGAGRPGGKPVEIRQFLSPSGALFAGRFCDGR